MSIFFSLPCDNLTVIVKYVYICIQKPILENISEGSVATHLRCGGTGGISNNHSDDDGQISFIAT